MGPLGWQETIFIFVLALLVFGPKKLPELGKTIGKAMGEFRRASTELKATWDREMAAVERESESIKDVTHSYTKQIAASYDDSSRYDSHDEFGYENGYNDPAPAIEPSSVGASATEGAELTAQAGETSASSTSGSDTTANAPAENTSAG